MSITVRLPDGAVHNVPDMGTLTMGRAETMVARKDGSRPAAPVHHLHLDDNPHLSALALEVRDLGGRYSVRCGENEEAGRIEVSTEDWAPFGTRLPFDNEITLTRPRTPVRLCLYDENRTVLHIVVETDTVDAHADHVVGETEVRSRQWSDVRDAPDWFLAVVALCRPLLADQGPPRPPEYRVALRLFNRCKQLSPTTTYAFNQALTEARRRVFLPEDAVFGRIAETAVRLEVVGRHDVTDLLDWVEHHR